MRLMRREKGQPLHALHPTTNHDDNRGVTFLVEATRPADLIVVDQPGYGPDYPVYGYAPYAYVWPLYVDGYAPAFIVHHPWEDRHAYGHTGNFFHGFAGPPLGAHAGGRFR